MADAAVLDEAKNRNRTKTEKTRLTIVITEKMEDINKPIELRDVNANS